MSAGVQSYPQVPQLAAGLMDIPSSLLSDSQPRLVSSQVRQVQLPSQSGNQQAGGVLNFQISTGVGQGYMKRGSCYLRTKIRVTCGADSSAAASTCLFDAAAAATVQSFGGPLAIASHVINRLTLLSGGSVIEQINNYHVVADILNAHASSKDYMTADAGMYENAFQNFNASTCDSVNAGGTEFVITVTIPLLSGLLQGAHHIPLFLLSGNLQLQLDLNPIASAFCGGVQTAGFENNTLMYEQLSVDAVMEATLKQSLMRAPFQIPFNSFVTLAAAIGAAGTVSQPIGLNLSSVYGVLVAQVAAPSTLENRKHMIKNGLSKINLFADGRLVNSYDINSDPLVYAEMNKVFNLAFDANRSSTLGVNTELTAAANSAKRFQFNTYVHTAGVCMTRVSEEGVVMAGSPVNQALVELTVTGAATAYYIVPHQLIFTVDIAGTAAVIR